MRKGKLLIVVMVIVIGGLLWRDLRETNKTATDYLLYIGLNDKDSYEQIVETEEAYAVISGICFKYVEGYTISEAKGVWKDETGTVTSEKTLLCYLHDIEEWEANAIMDDVLSVLNQNSILVEKRRTSDSYYYGINE